MSTVVNDNIRSRAEIHSEIELVPCTICGRTFQPRSLEKHYIACERSATIKRPVFDSMQKRLAGTELARYNSYILSPTLLRKKINNNNNTHSSTNSLNSNHEHRTARNTTVSRPLGRNERCPYCERQFGPRAYDDHVKWCKEHNILNKNHKKVDNSLLEAKERLDARIRYRVPPVQKSKKTLIREKYSTPSPCPLKRTESVHDLTIDRVESNNNLLKRTTSLRKPKNFCYSPKTPSTPLDFCDTSQFFSSTFSSNSNNNSSEYDYNPFKSAERQLMELLQCDDFKIFSEDENNTKTDAQFLNQHNITNTATTITPKTSSLSVKKSLPKIANFFRRSSSNKSNSNENLIMTSKPFTSKDHSIDFIDNNQSDSDNLVDKLYQSDKNNNINGNKEDEEEINEIDLIFINKNDTLTTLPQNTALYLNSYTDKSPINCDSNTNITTTVSSNNYLHKFLNDDCRDQNVRNFGDCNDRDNYDGNCIRNSELYDIGNQIPVSKQQKRQPKFCHECGTKYPIETAKFCVECGIKRLLF